MPGTYTSRFGTHDWTVTVAGQNWESAKDPDERILIGKGTEADPPWFAGFLAYGPLTDMVSDACHWQGTDVTPGPTVDDYATALAAIDGFETSAPVEVEVSGYRGKMVRLTVPSDVDIASCDNGEIHSFEGRNDYDAGNTEEVRVMDLDGSRYLFFTIVTKDAPADVRAELGQMVASLQVESAVAAAQSLPATGMLAAGTYYIDNRAVTNAKRMTVTLSAGWTTKDHGFLFRGEGTRGEVLLVPWVVSHLFPDACKWNEATVVDVGATVDQFVSALAAQQGRVASPVTDATIGGFPAKRIELMVPDTLDTTTCSHGNLRYWPGAGPDFNSGLCCNPAGNTDVVYAVDVAGKRLVLVARHYPFSSEENLAELQAAVDSIQIEP